MPASTSVGYCRNIYSRLKAIKAAAMKAATPVFLCCMKMAVAAPKAHAEWVDGKDELDGLETSSAKSRSIWQGRGLEIKFFSTSCPIRNTDA